MKKLLLGFIAFVGLTVNSHAVSMWDEVTNRDYCSKFRIAVAATPSSTSTILVDLNDTINWPHKKGGYAVVDGIRLDIDKAAASTTTVKVGVLTYVDYSSGTVSWFYTNENLLNVSGTDNDTNVNYGLFPMRCYVYPSTLQVAGITPYLITNDKIAISDSEASVFKSSATFLPSTLGFTTPGLGDIVMNIYKPIGTAVTIGIELFYHDEFK